MDKIKIRSEGMLGTQHSWAVTMRNLLLQFQGQGHKLYLKTINGTELIPSALRSRLDRDVKIPDLDICYTMPKNFESRFEKKSKVKMAIYNYETSKLPSVWLNTIKHVDYVLPSSQFSKEVFVNSGWPESKCIVIPHGINLEDYQAKTKYSLGTDKKFKFLNISIPHRRKNLDLLLDTYYDIFSDKDDVCLVLKTSFDLPKYNFEINVREIIRNKQIKYQNKIGGLPQVEIISTRIEDMAPLYQSCDALVSASSSEGFGLPFLEALASKKIVIAPRCSGQLDFLNDSNSLLVDVKEVLASPDIQYWVPSVGATTYLPISESLSKLMLKAYYENDFLQESFKLESNKTVELYTWENAAKKIMEIV